MKHSELQAVKGPPRYCRRCRKGPRKLYRVETGRGVLLGEWCLSCLNDLQDGEGVRKGARR